MYYISRMLKGLILIGPLALALVAGLPQQRQSAFAQTLDVQTLQTQAISCGDREKILSTLKNRYQEGRTAIGVTADGRLIEVFSAPSGSWSLLLTGPSGKTCLVSSGEGWRQISPVVTGPAV